MDLQKVSHTNLSFFPVSEFNTFYLRRKNAECGNEIEIAEEMAWADSFDECCCVAPS